MACNASVGHKDKLPQRKEPWLSTWATHQNHLRQLLKTAKSGLTPRHQSLIDLGWCPGTGVS